MFFCKHPENVTVSTKYNLLVKAVITFRTSGCDLSSLSQANKALLLEEYNMECSCSLSRNVWKITWSLLLENDYIFWTGVVVTYAVNGIIFMKYNFKLEQKTITFHAYYTKVPDSAFPCETGNNLLKMFYI